MDALAKAQQCLDAAEASIEMKNRAKEIIEEIHLLKKRMAGMSDEARAQLQAWEGSEDQMKLTVLLSVSANNGFQVLFPLTEGERDRKNKWASMFSDVPAYLSDIFHGDKTDEFYKNDGFWKNNGVVTVNNIKFKCGYNYPHYIIDIYVRKENGEKNLPSFFQLDICEWNHFYKKMIRLQDKIDSHPPGAPLQLFDQPQGEFNPGEETFWTDKSVITSFSGTVKFRPYLSVTNKLIGIFMETWKANAGWKQPYMILEDWKEVDTFVEFLGYNIDRLNNIEKAKDMCY